MCVELGAGADGLVKVHPFGGFGEEAATWGMHRGSFEASKACGTTTTMDQLARQHGTATYFWRDDGD